MLKHLILAGFLNLALFSACVSSTSNETSSKTTQPAASVKADNNDLLDLLQGRWQNDTDSTILLEIIETSLKRLKNNQIIGVSHIEIDANCQQAPCTTYASGWCFIEKTELDVKCIQVTECTDSILRLSSEDAAMPLQTFHKL